MTNPERRDLGLPYIADGEVGQEMLRARQLTYRLNTMDRTDFPGLMAVTKELLQTENDVFINPPFYCDYGDHIKVGKNVFMNYNCTVLDVGTVTIGDNCQFAPNVAIYTAGHPIHPDSRNSAYEYGIPVTIGNNCWIGGSSVILPGVTIGECCVIGAGSVVTRDIPAWSVAAGNPARVIRKITEEDRKFYFKDRVFDPESWEKIHKHV